MSSLQALKSLKTASESLFAPLCSRHSGTKHRFRGGLARPLSSVILKQGRHLCALYTGQVSPKTHLALLGIGMEVLLCSLPRSRLSRRHPPAVCGCSTSDFQGHYCWRQQFCSPDFPSNCSSLRDLNCTHSNYKTQKSPVSIRIVTT